MLKVGFVVAGGGIVGLATAYCLMKKFPKSRAFVLEKNSIASHQTGRNSGVIHSGIYYKPGSLKATTCRKGKTLLEEFCSENDVPVKKVGKLIVATDKNEEERLISLYERGKQNEIDCKLITKNQISDYEPYASGVAAIHVPETSVVNYRMVCVRLAQKIVDMGGNVCGGDKVIHAGNNIVITQNSQYACDYFINCGGLYADKIAAACGHQTEAKIIPFRGDYYTLSEKAQKLVKGLIYPVPDPRFPFLGVHFTKMVNGSVECGPNAVLALGRECYKKHQINFPELLETLKFPGFWNLSAKYWKIGLQEIALSLSKGFYVRSLRKLIPSIRMDHLMNNRPSGIRAQAVLKDGSLVDDFLIEKHGSIIHVINAPSPAATSCFAIGEHIVEKYALD